MPTQRMLTGDRPTGKLHVGHFVGTLAWIVAVVATVLAFRRAGAPTRLQVLLGASALIAGHTPPLAPVGLLCFAAASWMVLRPSGQPVRAALGRTRP